MNQLLSSPDTDIYEEFQASLQTLEQQLQENRVILNQWSSTTTHSTHLPGSPLHKLRIFPPHHPSYEATAFKSMKHKVFYLSDFSHNAILLGLFSVLFHSQQNKPAQHHFWTQLQTKAASLTPQQQTPTRTQGSEEPERNNLKRTGTWCPIPRLCCHPARGHCSFRAPHPHSNIPCQHPPLCPHSDLGFDFPPFHGLSVQL